ncbi:serum factor response D-like [Dermacentor albipictus]|uniref:serum factor response D-like n=1 Tax=Dermacentor albipictus TaxID=60249 RepID=UPI0038FD0B01
MARSVRHRHLLPQRPLQPQPYNHHYKQHHNHHNYYYNNYNYHYNHYNRHHNHHNYYYNHYNYHYNHYNQHHNHHNYRYNHHYNYHYNQHHNHHNYYYNLYNYHYNQHHNHHNYYYNLYNYHYNQHHNHHNYLYNHHYNHYNYYDYHYDDQQHNDHALVGTHAEERGLVRVRHLPAGTTTPSRTRASATSSSHRCTRGTPHTTPCSTTATPRCRRFCVWWFPGHPRPSSASVSLTAVRCQGPLQTPRHQPGPLRH